jgi:hypothetical protein
MSIVKAVTTHFIHQFIPANVNCFMGVSQPVGHDINFFCEAIVNGSRNDNLHGNLAIYMFIFI